MSFDWPGLRAGYERGITPTELARTMPNAPSRQAIEKHAKREGWQVARLPESDTNLPVSSRDIVLTAIGNGSNLELAAAAAGISDRTLYQWRKDDPAFEAACRAKRAAWLVSKIKQIDDADDWKAAAYMIERAPETKDQYSQKHEGGNTTIVLKIDRTEGVTIDGRREGTSD
jgi:hypothetical protein